MAQNKYARPENPITDAVLKNIDTKVRLLCRKFNDFNNVEKRENREHEIHSRLVEAVMYAYTKFKANDRCSWESMADRAIRWEVSHLSYDFGQQIKEERATCSGDERVNGGDEESPTFMSCREDPRDRFMDDLDRFDFEEVLEILRAHNPTYAKILQLRHDGWKLSEIYPMIGVQKWELYDVLWPAAAAAMKRIYDFEK